MRGGQENMIVSLAMLATKAATDMAMAKLVAMGVSSGVSLYVATKPRAYQQRKTTKKK